VEYQFERIITKDGIRLEGLSWVPKKPSKKALVFVHGLTDNFYGDYEIFDALAKKFNKIGVGLASFNNRGHDIVTGVLKKDKRKKRGFKSLTLGAAFEKFEDCIFDIEAGVRFLKEKGFRKIIVAGISTGANKTAYYFSKSFFL
jgi:alpha-beta hydrolase superfamily lysophospholipase